ncbi:NADP dehydrogenase [ubiquinone] iron-sulfur protein 2, mitochondrial [Plakobranchus ocellatus]|uniref:NADP dehydrogenase [ubiquinone] iron-sulfur protein 2, mitochondrial n=1 Tax=Plakobranchus ocellatus TaxID=259542 RepID=A0AAV3Z044_9GAST|nr:NADP dehydrogenase [ubiquinone] iron-sulfur protein 2, mitochondrial [Plakobranchus ocellatus]
MSTSAGQCTFPNDLQGQWLASNMGNVNFTSDQLEGYLACKFVDRDICVGVPTTWECFQTDGGDQYVLRTPSYTESGVLGRLYMCLYLVSLSSTKYLFYQGPQADHPSQRLSFVVGVADGQADPAMSDVCDLVSPFEPTRHHILVREDSTTSAKSFCPTEFLASFSPAANSTGCTSDINSCETQTDVVVSNTTCSPRVLFTDNGTLSCLHSLADGEIVYVTLYNQDESADGNNTYQFTCVAILLENNQVFLNQNPMDCDGFSVPTNSSADYTLDPNSILCTFESALQGSWVSNRKGQLTISTDMVSGFEPYGSSCTTCSGQPTEFECYQQLGTVYLIRSARTFINSQSVRIYVCVDTTFISSVKYIYYQAHSTTDSNLGDYLTTLNAAQPVNSLTEVCTQSTPYPAALYSVLLNAASPRSGADICPEDLQAIYNTSISTCDYTLSVCEVDTQVQLSSTACETLPFYTVGGVLSCIYSTTDGSITYLTLLNHDSSFNDNTTYQFTCIASTRSSTALQFTETPGGCVEGQSVTTVNTTQGNAHVFLYLASSTFPWIIIIGVAAGLIGLIVLILLIWYCCCGRECLAKRRERRRKAREGMDEESIIGSNDKSDEGDGEGKSQYGGSESGDVKGERKFMDIFTIAKGNDPTVKRHKKSKLKKRRHKKGKDGDKGEEGETSSEGSGSSYSDDFTSDEDAADSDESLSSQARFRKMFGSRYNLHVALAWAERQNDPELVQDEHGPRSRKIHEMEDMLRSQDNPPLPSGRSHPPGKIVSAAAVLGPDGWKKSKASGRRGRRKKRDRKRDGRAESSPRKDNKKGSRGIRGRSKKLDPLDLQGDPKGRRGDQALPKGPFPLLNGQVEFLAQYQAYTNTRGQLEDEGFFEAQDEKPKLAEEKFGFKEQEEVLNPPPKVREIFVEEEDFAKVAAEAGQKERLKSERRVVIVSQPPSSTVIPESDDADTGVDTHFDSRENTESDIRARETEHVYAPDDTPIKVIPVLPISRASYSSSSLWTVWSSVVVTPRRDFSRFPPTFKLLVDELVTITTVFTEAWKCCPNWTDHSYVTGKESITASNRSVHCV